MRRIIDTQFKELVRKKLRGYKYSHLEPVYDFYILNFHRSFIYIFKINNNKIINKKCTLEFIINNNKINEEELLDV